MNRSIVSIAPCGNGRALLKMLLKRLVKALKDYQLPESCPVGILCFRCEAAERQ